MSFDIDMENYGRDFAPAAAEQPRLVDTNSYQQEDGDLPQLPPESSEAPLQEATQQPVNPQSEHFRALREEVDRIKAEREQERRDYQNQLDMLRANLNNQNAPRAPEPQKRKIFEGMRDDDVPSVAEFRQEWERRESEYQSRLEELYVQQQHPDYAEVIEKFALPLVKQKPHLLEGIHAANNKALFAYEIGKMAQQIETLKQPAPTEPPTSPTAQRMVENSRKPGTLSQAGGQGALSKADYFASMSDSEFIKFASRNLDGI